MVDMPTQFSVEFMQELQRAQQTEVAQSLRNYYLSTLNFSPPVIPNIVDPDESGYRQREADRRYFSAPYPRPRASAVWDGTETRRLVHEYGGER